MTLRGFKSYLQRPIQYFEEVQRHNFQKISSLIDAGEYKDYPISCRAFLHPYDQETDWWMKHIIESQKEGYSLFLLYDNAMRKPQNAIRCLIPNDLATKYDLHTGRHICIEINRFKKIRIDHNNPKVHTYWNLMELEDFSLANPLSLRLVSRKESNEAAKLRNDILFNELDSYIPPHIRHSIVTSLFLAPKIASRSGIESQSFVENFVSRMFLTNLDSYNNVIRRLVPPEISNNLQLDYDTTPVPLIIQSTGDTLNLSLLYQNPRHYFNSECANLKEDSNTILRSISNNEIGINYQARFQSYPSKKELIDKCLTSEFFYKQDFLKSYAKNKMNYPIKLIKESRELLYNDYASRLNKKIESQGITITEKYKINQISEDICKEIGYKPKKDKDPYLNSISNVLRSNLHRVKSIQSRSGFITLNMGSTYLSALQDSLIEIKDSSSYKLLPKNPVETENIRRAMNNPLRSVIITCLKLKGNISKEDELISSLQGAGHDLASINKELRHLKEGGFVYAFNGEVHINTKRL